MAAVLANPDEIRRRFAPLDPLESSTKPFCGFCAGLRVSLWCMPCWCLEPFAVAWVGPWWVSPLRLRVWPWA
eukprot:7004798-Pyramimonas_sp.AAC.1